MSGILQAINRGGISHGVAVFTKVGANTFVIPYGIKSIKVEAIGGGGDSYIYAGGGGAYAVSASVSVTAGTTYYINVGANNATGTVSSATSISWGNTTNVNPTSSTTGVRADCGTNNYTAGLSTNSIGTTTTSGGSPGGSSKSGGGGAAGPSGVGQTGASGGGGGGGSNGGSSTAGQNGGAGFGGAGGAGTSGTGGGAGATSFSIAVAGTAGGGGVTPGFLGHSKYNITQRKWVIGDGGLPRLVWMPRILKEELRERLEKRAAELGIANFVDMIADETIGVTEDEILPFLTERNHPALTMESILG